MFSLKMNNIKSETLKYICIALARNKIVIPHFLTLNGEPTWPHHRFRIEVNSNSCPIAFPLYFDPPICNTMHETLIFDDTFKERLDIAVKSSVEIRVEGQVRNGSNRIQFTQGQARVDEIRKVQVWELDNEPVLSIQAYINPYLKPPKKLT